MTATPLPEHPAFDSGSAGEPPVSGQQSSQPPPAAPAPEPGARHLWRSSTNKVLGGVCGGLAEYTGTDPLLWRVGFIALALMGAGIFIYPLLWLVVPVAGPDGPRTTGIHDTLRNGRAPRS